MKQIKLSRGEFALVDDEDFEELNQHKWSVDSQGYVQRRGKAGDPCGTVRMHRQLMGHPRGDVDHVNLDRLDHRRCNLRLATRSQNMANGRRRANNTSGYIGVKRYGRKWIAQIIKDYRGYHVGIYATPEEAAIARDKMAVKLFGEYARLNFPALEANKKRRIA